MFRRSACTSPSGAGFKTRSANGTWDVYRAVRHNRVTRSPGLNEPGDDDRGKRRNRRLARSRSRRFSRNFEANSYGTCARRARVRRPAREGTLPGQQHVSGLRRPRTREQLFARRRFAGDADLAGVHGRPSLYSVPASAAETGPGRRASSALGRQSRSHGDRQGSRKARLGFLGRQRFSRGTRPKFKSSIKPPAAGDTSTLMTSNLPTRRPRACTCRDSTSSPTLGSLLLAVLDEKARGRGRPSSIPSAARAS